jgi:hypothetical protein
MLKHTVGLLLAVAAIGVASLSKAVADDSQVFPGPYSSWSATQKSQAAQMLNAASIGACQTYVDAATTSKGAQFEALACEAAYFIHHVPSDYPSYDVMKATAVNAYKSAQAAGANPPNFLASPP